MENSVTHDISDDSGLDLDLTEPADAAPEAEEPDTPSEGVDDALDSTEVVISDELAQETLDSCTEDELEEADCAPDPAPADVGRHARHDSNLTSRAQRKNRQRGR